MQLFRAETLNEVAGPSTVTKSGMNKVSVQPDAAVTTSKTSYTPGVSYNFTGCWTVDDDPSPNSQYHATASSELSKNSTIEVYDAIGKLVVKQVLANELNAINISNLNNGIYLFKVLNNSNIIKIGKLIKE